MFEYDSAKSAANKAKHGIDFEEAQALWTGETVEIPARCETERRTAVVGMIGSKHWTAFVTRREPTSASSRFAVLERKRLKSMNKRKRQEITAEELDRLFDEGGDISPYLDLASARRVQPKIRRFNVDLPAWAVSALDNAATRRGIARQALVKNWLIERLDKESERLVKK